MMKRCPVETLDKIFGYTAYSDPEKAQATLCSLMRTCTHFRTIAKRHSIRIVCLRNAKKVDAFAAYLRQVVESGDYGDVVLPIQHLAVAGKGSAPWRTYESSGAGIQGGNPAFIIMTAAPSLLTLTIFKVEAGRKQKNTGDQDLKLSVPAETTFPKLCDLVALNQTIIELVRKVKGRPDERACQLRYPSLRRLYIPGDGGGRLPSTLPYLEDLRWDMPYVEDFYWLMPSDIRACPPRKDIDHVHSLTIDDPQYPARFKDFLLTNLFNHRAILAQYNSKYGRDVEIAPVDRFTHPDPTILLSDWADAVAGGAGCWPAPYIYSNDPTSDDSTSDDSTSDDPTSDDPTSDDSTD
jgi:hypothetical protein